MLLSKYGDVYEIVNGSIRSKRSRDAIRLRDAALEMIYQHGQWTSMEILEELTRVRVVRFSNYAACILSPFQASAIGAEPRDNLQLLDISETVGEGRPVFRLRWNPESLLIIAFEKGEWMKFLTPETNDRR